MQDHQPPRFVLAFFRWFCRPELREDIEGDLVERFYRETLTSGKRKARWLFIKDVLFLFRPGIMRNFFRAFTQNEMNMKRAAWIKLAGVNLLIVLLILSPFIPGPSNKLVQVFSFIGQVIGFLGLTIVPTGLIWTIIGISKFRSAHATDKEWHYRAAVFAPLLTILIFLAGVIILPNPIPKLFFLFGLIIMLAAFTFGMYQVKKWKTNNENMPDRGASVILAISAMGCVLFLYVFLLLSTFVIMGAIPGILVLLVLPPAMIGAIRSITKLRDCTERRLFLAPHYCLTVPLIAFLTSTLLIGPASTFSRDFAIKRGETLIASIEAHKNKTGHYPETLSDLYGRQRRKAPQPFIMGIANFRYNKINNQYSLSFSQWTDLGLEEIVLYDKTNLRDNLPNPYAKYDYNFDLCRTKGAFASYDTRHSNWRYYLID